MNKDTVIFGLSHRDWLPHKCLSSLSRSKCRLSILIDYREWFSMSARNTTKATSHIRCFQVGILGCTFSELQASSEWPLAVLPQEQRDTTGCTAATAGGVIDNYSNGEDDQWSQWHRVWLAGPFICIHRIQHTVAIKYYQLCSFQIKSCKFVFQTLSQNIWR